MGLTGILIGSAVSLTFMQIFWKPIFLFSQGFKRPVTDYFYIFWKMSLISIGPGLIIFFVKKILNVSDGLVFTPIICIIIYTIVLFVFLVVSERGMRDFVNRFFKKSKH